MANPCSSYSPEERDAIAGWLREGLSSSRVARAFIEKFGRYVSRNAIIGVVHRDPVLAQIGFRGRPGPAVARTAKAGRGAVQRLRTAKAQRAAASKPKAPPAPVRVVVPEIVPVTVAPDPAEILAARAAHDRDSRRLTLAELGPFECKFAVNDAAVGEDHLFCGHPVAPDSPYCPHHTARAFNGTVSEAWRRRNGKGDGGHFRLKGIAA